MNYFCIIPRSLKEKNFPTYRFYMHLGSILVMHFCPYKRHGGINYWGKWRILTWYLFTWKVHFARFTSRIKILTVINAAKSLQFCGIIFPLAVLWFSVWIVFRLWKWCVLCTLNIMWAYLLHIDGYIYCGQYQLQSAQNQTLQNTFME